MLLEYPLDDGIINHNDDNNNDNHDDNNNSIIIINIIIISIILLLLLIMIIVPSMLESPSPKGRSEKRDPKRGTPTKTTLLLT